MKSYSLRKIEIISFIIACLLGVLSHFVYGWSGENPIVALFFPMNESTWEHLKLIFFPILSVSVIEYFIIGYQYANFIFVKLLSILTGMLLTIILFYTYTGVYGKNVDILNILLYFLSMAAAYYLSCRLLPTRYFERISGQAACGGYVILLFLFFTFTLFPPQIGLFISPV